MTLLPSYQNTPGQRIPKTPGDLNEYPEISHIYIVSNKIKRLLGSTHIYFKIFREYEWCNDGIFLDIDPTE